MSESWGGDAIPRPIGNLVEALAGARHLPAEAIDAAIRSPGRVPDAVLAAVERLAAGGSPPDGRDANLAVWGIHVLAQRRDPRLFAPLLRLLRRPGEDLAALFGEILDTTLPRILIACYNDDRATLAAAILNPDGDEYARCALLGALAHLAWSGRVARDEAVAILAGFDERRAARAGSLAWDGWERAIALLGLSDLADRVDAAAAEARLLRDEAGAEGFMAVLAEAAARPDDPTRFLDAGLWPLEDAVAELDEALAPDGDDAPAEPRVNPLRSVGRNDPCPCGSGLKFKRCCLPAAADGTAP